MIPLSVPMLGGNELLYVNQALTDGWVSSGGPSIPKFEDEFACYSGVEYTAACQSGTAAMHLALADAGVSPGDLVIAPTLTFIASVNPVSYVGAEPVFMDCDDSLCIDPDKLENYLHDECESRDGGLWYDKSLGKPLKAIIVVHVFGNTADIERIIAISKAYNLILIEDAAEAVGTFYSSGVYAGKMAGSIGDYGVFSFNGNKIITTGGGGMLTSPESERVRHMRHLSTQAKIDEVYYMHDEIGYNYRMTNLQAAIGLAQLEQLEMFIDIKRNNYGLYNELGIKLLPFRGGCRPNYWFYSYMCPITCAGGTNGSNSGNGGNGANNANGANGGGNNDIQYRDKLIRYLFNKGIQTRPIWGLCHEQPMYRNNRTYRIERAYDYHNRVVNLPCSTSLTEQDIRRVAEEIHAFAKQ